MRLLALTTLVMVAFASNSILNRLALASGEIGAMPFGLWRVASGAAALAVLIWWRDRSVRVTGPHRGVGVASLVIYFFGFSAAYLNLDAGAGALILFGGVQVTMFAGALLAGERVPALRFVGAAVALVGLAWLLWPRGDGGVSLLHGVFMGIAALGWGVYSLVGRKSGEPLRATGANFLLATPFVAVGAVLWPSDVEASAYGILLALVCGIVTSALGYALWYQVLGQIKSTVAAVAQLTVPVIALVGGAVILGEQIGIKILIAAVLVLGGVGMSILPAGKR